jgi:HTH-type transcriptional regulator/antitoxin HipB
MRLITAKDLGKLVRNTRRKAKLTQSQLAAASATGERFIRELEKGKPTAQLEKALLVVQMLGIKIEAEPPFLMNEPTP